MPRQDWLISPVASLQAAVTLTYSRLKLPVDQPWVGLILAVLDHPDAFPYIPLRYCLWLHQQCDHYCLAVYSPLRQQVKVKGFIHPGQLLATGRLDPSVPRPTFPVLPVCLEDRAHEAFGFYIAPVPAIEINLFDLERRIRFLNDPAKSIGSLQTLAQVQTDAACQATLLHMVVHQPQLNVHWPLFRQLEEELMDFRWRTVLRHDLTHFYNRLCQALAWEPQLAKTSDLEAALGKSLAGCASYDTHLYAFPFEVGLPLLAKKTAYIHRGRLYVAARDAVSLCMTLFKTRGPLAQVVLPAPGTPQPRCPASLQFIVPTLLNVLQKQSKARQVVQTALHHAPACPDIEDLTTVMPDCLKRMHNKAHLCNEERVIYSTLLVHGLRLAPEAIHADAQTRHATAWNALAPPKKAEYQRSLLGTLKSVQAKKPYQYSCHSLRRKGYCYLSDADVATCRQTDTTPLRVLQRNIVEATSTARRLVATELEPLSKRVRVG